MGISKGTFSTSEVRMQFPNAARELGSAREIYRWQHLQINRSAHVDDANGFLFNMASVQSLVSKKKKSFIGLPAPLGYVPGLGRG